MSTETTPAETRSPRWTGLSNDERLLLPDEATSPPAAVLAANQQAVATFGRYRQARADYFQSEERLKAAPVLDRQADAAASASDQPLPTKRAEPAAREAFQAAQRRMQASLDAFQQSERDLSTAILTARHEWQQSQAACVTALREEGEDLLARLAHVLEQLEAERRIETQLQEFPVQGSLTLVNWGRQSERAKQMAAAVRERADEDLRRQDRQGGSHSSLVRRDVASLVAAVRVVLEGPEGRGPVNTFVSGNQLGDSSDRRAGGR